MKFHSTSINYKRTATWIKNETIDVGPATDTSNRCASGIPACRPQNSHASQNVFLKKNYEKIELFFKKLSNILHEYTHLFSWLIVQWY